MPFKPKPRPPRGRPRYAPYHQHRRLVKKVTAKGAYKSQAKRQMGKRRRPFVETKRRVHSITVARNASTAGVPAVNYPAVIEGVKISNASAFTLLDLSSYYRNSHGFLEDNVIGDSLFSRYLKLKIQLRFPEGEDMIVNPVRIQLITGWVTAPLAYTNNTTPTEGNATQAYLLAHLVNQLKEYFDERNDFLRFREKTTSNVRILKWQSLKPNLNTAIASVPGQTAFGEDQDEIRTTGAVPFVQRSFTWKTNRKVHLSEGTALPTGNDAPDSDTQNLYPNNQWLPFACLYNPEFARMRNVDNEDVECTLAQNNIHFYTDS